MKAKDLRAWCDRMGDDADVEVRLTTYYMTGWSTDFVADSVHEIRSAFGSGSKGGFGNLAPKIVLPTSCSVPIIKHPCPVCQQNPPDEH